MNEEAVVFEEVSESNGVKDFAAAAPVDQLLDVVAVETQV